MKAIALAVSALIVAAAAAGATVPGKTFGAGTHLVSPSDVPPGTYRALGGHGCYWERLKSFSGELSAIIVNANPVGPALVTIKPTDKGFNSHSCGRWTSNLRRITKSTTRFGAGTYIVRTDITSGTYRAPGGVGCYWARLRNFTGEFNGIIASGNPTGQAVVTIAPTDKGFESRLCGTWSRF